MLTAKITWAKSVSPEVVGQNITVKVNDIATVVTLAPDVQEYSQVVNAGDVIHVDLFAYSKVFRSTVLSFSATAPNLPEAPTNGNIEFVGDEAPTA